jgi:hypothetical protein
MRVPRAGDRLMGDIELIADALGSDSLMFRGP